MNCSFRVGDKIFDIYTGNIAVVTNLTEKGFRYELLKAYNLYWDKKIAGGECFCNIVDEIDWELYNGSNKVQKYVTNSF